nr:hypothetical protein [Tanacetum cinerariifolium]
KSVASSFSQVIFIGSISIEVPVALEVGTAVVASHVRVLELDTHSSSEADPSESSPPPVSVAPMVSPFLCSDDSESATEIPERHIHTTPILPSPYAIVAPSSEFPLAPVVAPPEICRRQTILIRPAEDIPIGRLYRTHPDGPYTTDAKSSTPSRFVHPPLSRTPRCSEAYLRWRSAPQSTMYPPTTSESSAGDSSFESSAGPSRKRCRSPAATMTSSIHATRALVPSRTDLLSPRKRFRHSILPEDSVEEDIDTDVLGEIEDDVEEEVESSDRGTMEVGVDMVAWIGIPDCMPLPDAVE